MATFGAAVVGVIEVVDGEEDAPTEEPPDEAEFDDDVVAPARLCSAKTPTSPSVLMVARTPAARVDLAIRC